MKIATHDSATGESGLWYCLPLIPFAKTQSKTIVEQYNAGCKVFDFRVKEHNNKWHCAHGLWITKDTCFNMLLSLATVMKDNNETEPVYVSITFEGKNPNKEELLKYYHHLIDMFSTNLICPITFMYLAIKYGDESSGVKVKYSYLEKNPCNITCKQAFKQLDGRSWHTYLPIPWLWKKIYYNKPEFNETEYKYVDFL